ncbi:MAG: VWA domain-containing protein [Rhizobiales bacterium]|nr:VWA domain-containing protein [Hyphomicrobiales bacterium]
MLIRIFSRRLRGCLAAFRRSERGNVMVTFALTLIPMLGLVGAAVDYSRGNSAKVAMQAANDSTALMLSKEAQKLGNGDDLKEKAVKVFTALFHRPEVTDLIVTPNFVDDGTGSFRLTVVVTGKVPTTFTKILGKENMDLGASSEVVWGVKKLELAMALDVTGSMSSNNKMVELKKAAKSLLTTLKGAAKKDGDVKVAIVPFAVHVNVGTSNVNASWLDWSAWMAKGDDTQEIPDGPAIMATRLQNTKNKNAWDRAGPGTRCPFTTNNYGFGCTDGPASKSNDSTKPSDWTIPTSDPNNGLICPSRDNGGESTAATGVLTNSYHNGCYRSDVKPDSDWHPVTTGSGASCGNLPSSKCQCTGNNNNKVCAMTPQSDWEPLAMGSSASCGNLSSTVCQCFGSGSSKVCKQKTYTHVWRPRPKTAWDGCVRDRNQDYDSQNTAPTFAWTNTPRMNINNEEEGYQTATAPSTADAFQPFQHYTCPAALLPLTSNWTDLENKVDELQPNGNTNVTIGLAWAFHAITASAPLNASAPTADLDKVIILLTDGDNTQNRWSTSSSAIDERTKKACANVKAAGIKLYTIRVINGNGSLLQACATRPDMYYNVQNASELNGVFTTIAQELANLRIAK